MLLIPTILGKVISKFGPDSGALSTHTLIQFLSGLGLFFCAQLEEHFAVPDSSVCVQFTEGRVKTFFHLDEHKFFSGFCLETTSFAWFYLEALNMAKPPSL